MVCGVLCSWPRREPTTTLMNPNTLISFIVPVKDEAATLKELYAGISEQITKLGHQFELIFIDDGSTDGSWSGIQNLAAGDFRVSGIRFPRSLGRAHALNAGFKAAKGEVIFTTGAHFQGDPGEIGRHLQKLDQGSDLVSTRHETLHTPVWSRHLNAVVSWLIDVARRDQDSGFTSYRSKLIADLKLCQGTHRLAAGLASKKGHRVTELSAKNQPKSSQAQQGTKRHLEEFADLPAIYSLKEIRERLLHLVAGTAISSLVVGLSTFTIGSFGMLGASARWFGLGLITIALLIGGVGLLAEWAAQRCTRRNQLLPAPEKTRPPLRALQEAAPTSASVPTGKEIKTPLPVVLVADDDKISRAIFRMQLTRAGFQVQEAASGNQALAKITHDTKVVLLDINMPDGNGIHALREIRQRYSHLKVVIVSADEDLENAVIAMKLGAFDYLVKHANREAVVTVARRALQTPASDSRQLSAA